MKKSLIALAVAGAMTAPMVAQADATIYGDVEYNINKADNTDLDMGMGHVRFGVKGTVDNDIDGLSTGYQLEFQMPSGSNLTNSSSSLSSTTSGSVATRQANIYMGGDFGTVKFGHQTQPSEVAETGFGQDGDYWNMLVDRFQGVSYTTPDMGGFSAAVGIGASDGYGTDTVDVANLGLSYAAGDFSVALGYFDVADGLVANTGGDVTALGFVYAPGDLEVQFGYQTADYDSGAADTDVWLLGAAYSFDKTTVYGEYSEVDENGAAADDNDLLLLGAKYALGSKVYVGAEYYAFDTNAGTNGDEDYLSLFYRLKF